VYRIPALNEREDREEDNAEKCDKEGRGDDAEEISSERREGDQKTSDPCPKRRKASVSGERRAQRSHGDD
jgi:hypothetical protein